MWWALVVLTCQVSTPAGQATPPPPPELEGLMDEYTPGQVWSILVNGSDDENEEIDLAIALVRMPFKEQAFLRLLAAGFPVGAAMQAVGMKGNQTRVKRDMLTWLTKEMNGEDE